MTRVFFVSIGAASAAATLGVDLDLFVAEGGRAYDIGIAAAVSSAANPSVGATVTATILQDPLPGPVTDITPNASVTAIDVPAFPINSFGFPGPTHLETSRISNVQVETGGQDRMLKIRFDSASAFTGLNITFEISVTEVQP